MKQGIFDNITNEEYHKKHALSKSGLVNLANSPFYYQWCRQNPKEPTPAMLLGTHVHTRILEPSRHREEYVVAPDVGDKRKKENKAKWEAFLESAKGKIIVTQDEMDLVDGMAESIGKSETASALLSGGIAEQSVFWKHPVHGFDCQCRPDYLNPKHEAVIDLKTTNNISDDALAKTISNFRYHWQASWYLDGMQAVKPDQYSVFFFIFVENKAPFQVAIRVLDQDSLNIAEIEMEPLLKQYAECLKTDIWPGIPDDVGVVELPHWHKNRVLFN